MRPIDADIIKFLKEQKVKETGAFSKGLNKGLNIAISAIKNPQICPTIEQPTWISVDDRLPEKEERVLVWNGKGLVQLCRYQYRYDIRKKRFRETFYTDGNKMPYTAKYWMPLPQPPKGVE